MGALKTNHIDMSAINLLLYVHVSNQFITVCIVTAFELSYLKNCKILLLQVFYEDKMFYYSIPSHTLNFCS